ncbi:MAG: hypothetical protein J7K85_08920 [Anaerolineaceae bacterium]|nr:hypothetical protein [Anaerolineaceae bacterium]
MKQKLIWFLCLFTCLILLNACQAEYDENVVVYNFDENDEGVVWSEKDDNETYRGVMDGEYVMQIRKGAILEWENLGQEFSDVKLTINAMDIGVAQDGSYGLICNYQDELNYYLASIGKDGYYFIAKTVNGDDFLLLGSEDGSYLRTDKIDPSAEAYHIGMDCVEGQISLLLDNEVLGTVQDDTFTSGDVGFFAISFVQTPLQINFDRLTIEEVNAGTE